MYRFFHYLFGWDYVAWSNFADQGIARVHVAQDGRVYYWRYRSLHLFDVIIHPKQVLWLTCMPYKYLHWIRSSEPERVGLTAPDLRSLKDVL